MLKETIVKVIAEKGPLKATELPVQMEIRLLLRGEECCSTDLLEALEELVVAGEIIEVEYALPHMDYRIKSLYFPKGSQIVVRAEAPSRTLDGEQHG